MPEPGSRTTRAVSPSVDANTSYYFLAAALFVMGMGTGSTMMPVLTAALQTLKPHQIARGSTMTNIAQQVAASIGTAVFTVVLTSYLKSEPLAQPAIASQFDPTIADQLGPTALTQGLQQAAQSRESALLD